MDLEPGKELDELVTKKLKLELCMRYSTEPSAALELIEILKKDGLIINYRGDSVQVELPGPKRNVYSSADTMPHALCLAAARNPERFG